MLVTGIFLKISLYKPIYVKLLPRLHHNFFKYGLSENLNLRKKSKENKNEKVRKNKAKNKTEDIKFLT